MLAHSTFLLAPVVCHSLIHNLKNRLCVPKDTKQSMLEDIAVIEAIEILPY